jgi:hypothetical protein
VTGTSWRAVSVPTQKSNGDGPRGPGRVTPSPGRSDVEAARVNGGGGPSGGGRRVNTALVIPSGTPPSTPDSAAFQITGDLDVRWVGKLSPWSNGTLLSQYDAVFGGLRSWLLSIVPGNLLRLTVSSDGAADLTHNSTVAIPFPQTDAYLGLRATIDVNDGGGNRVVTFYTSPDLGATWVQLGDPVTVAGAITLHNSTAAVFVNGHSGGIVTTAGTVVEAQVRQGIDGALITNPRFSDQPVRQPSFTDDQARTWTIASPSLIAVV